MPGIDDILGLAKLFESASGLILKTRADWRDAAARYLRRVAACLTEIDAELQRGRAPAKQFARLAAYARQMPKTVTNILGKAEAANLREALVAANAARSTLTDARATRAFRTVLARAAGELEAAADIVEAS